MFKLLGTSRNAEGINTEVAYQDLAALDKVKKRQSDANSSAQQHTSHVSHMCMLDQTNIIVLDQPDAVVTHDVFLSSKAWCAVLLWHISRASNQPRHAFRIGNQVILL